MFSSSDYLILPVIACIAVGLDFMLGEPKRYHPLIGFGWLAKHIERTLNSEKRWAYTHQRLRGFLALVFLIIPFIGIAILLRDLKLGHLNIGQHTSDVLLLYFSLGHKSLHEHAYAVTNALNQSDTIAAKTAASYMVSRDPAEIEPVPATIESVLENGSDGVFGALFWFFVGGGIGALAFRLINTMDAMWGYKSKRYYYFGWAAARLDDTVNYLPARLTALTYALLGHTQTALRCWQHQAPRWDSPNAGPVMASGAGALHIQLGGPACYQGEWHQRPILGEGTQPATQHIAQALRLVRHGVLLWLILSLLIAATVRYSYA